jgi:peptide/nickel transport system ATP-binding protein
MSLVEVDGLRVELVGSGAHIVDDVNLRLEEGEVTALVGESGSGKTTIGVALLGDVRRGATIAGGTVRVTGIDVFPAVPKDLRSVRGRVVAYIPQDPAAALNPAMRIGTQIEETLAAHKIGGSAKERRDRARAVLEEVKLPSDPEFLRRFPHQLSGGQQQRVCMAIAVACEPRVLILDEPTTGLDVTTQAHVLATLTGLVTARKMSALYVTHDLAVVANLAQRVVVLYSGRIVEDGNREAVFRNPSHPYTRKLLAAIPDVASRRQLDAIPGQAPAPTERPSGCSFAPRCPLVVAECKTREPPPVQVETGQRVRCFRAHELEPEQQSDTLLANRVSVPEYDAILIARDVDVHYGARQVLHSVGFELRAGECLALVGESGSGKTTLARSLVGLTPTRTGEIRYADTPLPAGVRDYPAEVRRHLQYVFQSPYNSLNPRRQVGAILETPLRHFFGLRGSEAKARIVEALEKVSLGLRVARLYPSQLSGGERQRVAIARALVCQPTVILCDEITSALDVSVQASIVALLRQLQEDEHLSLLFVTHNIGLVRTIADRVVVMNQGRVVEWGATDDVLDSPADPYTQRLVADTPSLEEGAKTAA